MAQITKNYPPDAPVLNLPSSSVSPGRAPRRNILAGIRAVVASRGFLFFAVAVTVLVSPVLGVPMWFAHGRARKSERNQLARGGVSKNPSAVVRFGRGRERQTPGVGIEAGRATDPPSLSDGLASDAAGLPPAEPAGGRQYTPPAARTPIGSAAEEAGHRTADIDAAATGIVAVLKASAFATTRSDASRLTEVHKAIAAFDSRQRLEGNGRVATGEVLDRLFGGNAVAPFAVKATSVLRPEHRIAAEGIARFVTAVSFDRNGQMQLTDAAAVHLVAARRALQASGIDQGDTGAAVKALVAEGLLAPGSDSIVHRADAAVGRLEAQGVEQRETVADAEPAATLKAPAMTLVERISMREVATPTSAVSTPARSAEGPSL